MQIRAALNQQTAVQFAQYAQQQCPNNKQQVCHTTLSQFIIAVYWLWDRRLNAKNKLCHWAQSTYNIGITIIETMA